MTVSRFALLLVLTLVLAAPGVAPAQAAEPSVRSQGADLRFVDPDVAGRTRTVQGTLVETSAGAQRYFVELDDGRAIPVDFRDTDLPSRARGSQVDLEVSGDGDVRTASIAPISRAAATAPSAHRAYVAKVSNKGGFLSNDATILATVDAALARWREESNGAITSFTRVEVKPFATTTDCSSGSAMYNEAARDLFPGISTGSTSGNHVMVISPQGCAGGVGTVQAGIASGGRLNARWNPDSTLHTLMHELGHNFSLDHANACYEPLGPGCVVQEYANTYAIMGYTLSNSPAYTPAALDSFERARLGIADEGEIAPVTLPAGRRTISGVYDLRARGTTTGLRGLRVTDPITGTVHSVDWRSGGARDALSGYALDPVKDNYGVTVQRIAADGESAAVLGHANPDPGRHPLFGLTAGRTFRDAGTTITVASTGDRADPDATARVGITLTDPTVAPDTLITAGPAGGAVVQTPSVELAFTGDPSDATAGFDCRLDGGSWSTCATPATVGPLADGTHTFEVRARDAADHVDGTPATRTFVVDTRPAPAPATAPGPALEATGPTPAPSTPSAGTPGAARAPAKLEVARASVSPSTRRLTLLAPITARASGVVRVAFRAGGRTTTFDAPIDVRRRRVAVSRRVSAVQARGGTGILTLTYRGDADTQPQTVRVRAAARPAELRAGRPTLTGGVLRASGTVARGARGVVRVQVLFEPASGATRTLAVPARITGGRYALTRSLPADVLAAVATRRGVLHAYVLYTGDLPRRLRGELASFQVLGRP